MTETSPFPIRVGLRVSRAITLTLLALLLHACATAPTKVPDADREQAMAQAQAHIDDGRPLAAVRVYRDLAETADPAERQRWRLRIVELLFDEGYPELALDYHRQLDAEPVPASLATRKRVVDAQAAIVERQGVRALRLLPDADEALPQDVRARILEARADAYELTGQPARALAVRIRRGELLDSPEAIQRNDERTWSLLRTIPMERLQRLREIESQPILRGWADLALTIRRARLGERPVTEALADWEARHRDHPATGRFAPTLRDRIVAEVAYPEKIALLLPLSGRYSAPASAVRDGLLTAYYNQPSHVAQPELLIFDTGEEGQGARAAYQRAVDAGAGFVIGPLDKAAVAELAQRTELPVPVLTLNYLPPDVTTDPRRLMQFGLLPEDEARQAADAAIQSDHYNALAFVPAGDWGNRMLTAFRERFEEQGGVLLNSMRYNNKASDHGRQIRALLDLDQSYIRRRRVAQTIGDSVRFEPRRREDVEIIFVAATPSQARVIEPQLEFHRAAGLPVYATSHVFTGKVDPQSDWDMNGLFFNDMPWILDNLDTQGDLHRQVTSNWPNRYERFPRLYALGIDALAILPHLERLRIDTNAGFSGRTGHLQLDERGRIRRNLQWALFEEGRPRPVTRPEIDDEEDETIGDDVRERVDDS